MRRQLEDYARGRIGGQGARGPAARPGRRNASGEDYGRIESADGRLIYFHRRSVVGADFDRLEIGAEVRFDEEAEIADRRRAPSTSSGSIISWRSGNHDDRAIPGVP